MKVRAVLVAVVLLLPTAACGTSTGSSAVGDSCNASQAPVKAAVGFQPVFIPLKVTVNSSGEVDVSLAVSWSIGIGTIDAELGKNDDPAPPGVHRLVVSHRKDGRQVWDRYEIRCDRASRIFLNGRFRERVSTAETVIEAEPGSTSTIVVVDAAAPVGPDLRPLPEYQPLRGGRIELPDPLGEYGLGSDLDADNLTTDNFVAGGKHPTENADIFYEYGTGLMAGYDALLGITTKATRTPQQCRKDASSRKAGKVPIESLSSGRRFCVFTSAGNVALLVLTKARTLREDPGRKALTFQVTRWIKT